MADEFVKKDPPDPSSKIFEKFSTPHAIVDSVLDFGNVSCESMDPCDEIKITEDNKMSEIKNQVLGEEKKRIPRNSSQA